MKKFLSLTMLVFAIFVFATWQYRLLSILLFVFFNKSWIKSLPWMNKYKHSFKLLVSCLLVGIFIAIPNYWQRGDIQLIYLDKNGKEVKPPLPVYIVNAIIPEEEACNLAIKATALMPSSGINLCGHKFGSSFVNDARNDFWKGKMLSFYSPYNEISWRNSNPGSFVYGQLWNEVTGDNLDAIYIMDNRPFYIRNAPTSVVFFCHGYLGSWELYQGFLSGLKDCVVVSMGTRDLSGIFSYNDINRIYSKYIPYLASKGYMVNTSDIHIIGLSNGGSASNVAMAYFPDGFRSVTYISTSCDVIKRTNSKVLLVGGGKDYSSRGLKSANQRLRQCGTRCSLFFDENEKHYVMVHDRKEVLDFLNQELLW